MFEFLERAFQNSKFANPKSWVGDENYFQVKNKIVFRQFSIFSDIYKYAMDLSVTTVYVYIWLTLLCTLIQAVSCIF